MKTRAALSLLLLCSVFACAFAPPLYWGEDIHGRVVDAENGAPIEGAVVLADWKLYGGGIGHGGHRNSLFVAEMLTNGNGEFSFGKWGPKLRPLSNALDNAPWLVVFKSGYEHRFLPNEHDSNWFVRRSDWDGKTIELKRFRGISKERLFQLDTVLMVSAFQPRMLGEILKEKDQYYSQDPTFFDHIATMVGQPTR